MQQFRNIHNKTPVSEYLFNKFAGLKACNFIKKRLQLGCFFCEYCEMFMITHFEEHVRAAASGIWLTISD